MHEEEIIKIESIGKGEVWDIEVEEDHSYLAEGFVNHNSSSSPNTQNFPRASEDKFKIREAFVSSPKKSFIIADYSQAEVRVIAHLAEDYDLIEDLKGDVYKKCFSRMFAIPEEEVTKPQRALAKVIVLGTNYGMGPVKLANDVDIKVGWENTPYLNETNKIKVASELLKKYFKAYPNLKEYIDVVPFLTKNARPFPHVRTILGRYRRFPDILSVDVAAVKAAEREAVNTGPQGGVGDMMRGCMIQLYENKEFNDLGGKILLQIHDELVVEIDTEHAKRGEEIVKDMMENCLREFGITFSVPMLVESAIASKWIKA